MAKNILRTIVRGKNILSSIRPGKLQLQNASVPLPNPFDVGMSTPSDLLGRDMVSFENYTTEEIYSLLWIALDLKQKEHLPKMAQGKSVTVISSNPVRKISLSSAGTRLGASTTFVRPADINFENMDFEILGKTLGSACDMVVVDCQDLNHKNVEDFATGCTVPVICVESSKLCPLYCLSELLTLSEHYEYLRRIIISYVGEASDQLLNTYALLLPKLGMHLNFFINENMDQTIWKQGIQLSAEYNTELKQFENLYENLYRSHVISIAPNRMDLPAITIKDTKEMDLNWTILHKNVLQKSNLTSKEFLRCQQSLVWKNLNNMQWIFGATLIATTTPKYSPTISRPQFEGQP